MYISISPIHVYMPHSVCKWQIYNFDYVNWPIGILGGTLKCVIDVTRTTDYITCQKCNIIGWWFIKIDSGLALLDTDIVTDIEYLAGYRGWCGFNSGDFNTTLKAYNMCLNFNLTNGHVCVWMCYLLIFLLFGGMCKGY